MAQRKSLLEEIQEQNSGTNFNKSVVDSSKKYIETSVGISGGKNSANESQPQRKSLLQEIVDSDGMDGLNQDYTKKALDFDGGFGAMPGGYIQGEDGKVYMHDYKNNAEILKERIEQTKAKNTVEEQKGQEDLSFGQQIIDRILGDRTQVTNEKTNWWELAKGVVSKGAHTWNSLNWKTMNFLFGGIADELHTIGTETVNKIIGGLNSIPGVDIDYIEPGKNLIQRGYEDAQAGLQQATDKYAANAVSSRAAQIADKFGTSTVAAIPMALEAMILAPTQAAQAAGTATTAGLEYFSGLQGASGLTATSMMAKEGLRKMVENPQFWTSYLQVAGDGYEDALEDGMSEDDAALYGLVNGFFNAMIEIGGADEALGGIQNLPMRLEQARENGSKRAVVEWFKDSVLGEGKEEVLQGLFERGLKTPMTPDNGASGFAEKWFSLDPQNQDAVINPFTAADEFVGGAAVGALLGGGQAATQSISNNSAYKGDAKFLIDTAKQTNTSEAAQARIKEIEESSAKKGGSITKAEAGELVQMTKGSGISYESAATIRGVVSDLEVGDEGMKVLLDGYKGGEANATTYAFGVREAFQLGKMGLSLETATERAKLGAELNETQFRHAWQLGAGQKSVTDTDVADVATPEGKERLASALSMLGEHAQAAADAYDGKQDVARFAAAMNKAANLYAANGVDVKALAQELQDSGSKDIISYLSEEQLETAAKIGAQIRAQNEAESKKSSARLTTLREQAAAILAAGGRSTQALNNIDKAIAAASKYGQQEYSLYQEKLAALEEMVKADPEAENTEAYQKAYEEAEEHYQNAVEARNGIDNLEEKRKELQAKQPIKRKKGTVSFEGGTDPNTGKQLKAVDQTKLSKHQKNVVSMVEALADIINIDYVFFDGDSNTGGEYIGDGVIYININSGVTRNFAQGIAAASLSHELTHFMQEYAPEEYNELKDFIVSEVMKKSPSEFDALVKQQLAWQPDLNYAQAVDEVIANSCQNMLLNSQHIAQFAREHMTAAEKIKDTIHDIVGKIKAAYEGIDFKSDEGPFRAVRAVIDQSEMIQKRWDKALEAATKNYNAEQIAGNRQQESELKAAAQTTGVKYQAWSRRDINRAFIDYNNADAIKRSENSKIKSLISRGKVVTINPQTVNDLLSITDWANPTEARRTLKNILKNALGKNSVFFQFDGSQLEAFLTREGRNHAAGGQVTPEKASIASAVRQLILNSEYAFSSIHDRHSVTGEHIPGNTEWDYFIAVAKMGTETIPVEF